MSQRKQDDSASQANDAKPTKSTDPTETVANERRDFLRQSLGVAPLMLTLSGKYYDKKTSMEGTLWASPGGDHKGDWDKYDDGKDDWQWSKTGDDKYDDGKYDTTYYSKTEEPAPDSWNYDSGGDAWKTDINTDSKSSTYDWDQQSGTADKDYNFDDGWSK